MENPKILFTLQTPKMYYSKLQLYLSRVGVKLTISLWIIRENPYERLEE
jgi:hypothetical protein